MNAECLAFLLSFSWSLILLFFSKGLKKNWREERNFSVWSVNCLIVNEDIKLHSTACKYLRNCFSSNPVKFHQHVDVSFKFQTANVEWITQKLMWKVSHSPFCFLLYFHYFCGFRESSQNLDQNFVVVPTRLIVDKIMKLFHNDTTRKSIASTRKENFEFLVLTMYLELTRFNQLACESATKKWKD